MKPGKALYYMAWIAIAFGVAYMLVPTLAGGMIWKSSNPGGWSQLETIFARFVGIFLLMWGVTGLVASRSSDPATVRGCLQVNVIGHILIGTDRKSVV